MMGLHGEELHLALSLEVIWNSLLSIPGNYVILPTIFPRYRTRFDLTNSILEDLVRYLLRIIKDLSVIHLDIYRTRHNARLKIVRVGHTFDDHSFLKDGIHMNARANEAVARKLIKAVQFTEVIFSPVNLSPPDIQSPSQFPSIQSCNKRKQRTTETQKFQPLKKSKRVARPFSLDVQSLDKTSESNPVVPKLGETDSVP